MKLFLITLLLGLTCFAETKSMTVSISTPAIAYTQAGSSIKVDTVESIAALLIITDATPVSKTFTVNSSDDTFTTSSHGFETGLAGTVSSTGTLPGGLAGATTYYVIDVTDNTYKLATSSANAVLGTAINISSDGTLVRSFIPAALTGGAVKLQMSNDNLNWVDIPTEHSTDTTKSATITATSNKFLAWDYVRTKWARLYYTITTGQLTQSQQISVKK